MEPGKPEAWFVVGGGSGVLVLSKARPCFGWAAYCTIHDGGFAELIVLTYASRQTIGVETGRRAFQSGVAGGRSLAARLDC